jgi:hypothetical protein
MPKKWKVWDDCVEDFEPFVTVAPSAKAAAQEWAIVRGHDVDDFPVVNVSGPIGARTCKTVTFTLSAVVTWRATRTE